MKMPNFNSLFSRLPLIGGLTKATPKLFKDSAYELTFVWSLSLLPMAVSIFVHYLGTKDSTLKSAISENIHSGEIFIYVNSLLMPITYILYKHSRDAKSYPNWMSTVWTITILSVFSLATFVLQRSGKIENLDRINMGAFIFFIIAFLLRYTAIIYDNLRVDFVSIQRSGEEELKNKLDTYR